MLCKRLLPVDESLIFSKNTYSNTENTLQGFKYYFPSLKTPYSVINNGFETEKIKTDISKKIKNTFVAVAPINDLVRFRLKGIDKIFDLAKKLPNCSFSIVGISSELKISLQTIPENITLYEFLPFEIFRQVLEKSEFYFQLSISEGFPNALCEAMLCNCIPIGSDVGAIPYIISETGFIMKHSEINYLTEELSKIIDLEDSKRYELALNSRKRIVDNFDISKREKAFLNLIENKL
jgi:glycosyltransferase involved in cell wall biosynthesis